MSFTCTAYSEGTAEAFTAENGPKQLKKRVYHTQFHSTLRLLQWLIVHCVERAWLLGAAPPYELLWLRSRERSRVKRGPAEYACRPGCRPQCACSPGALGRLPRFLDKQYGVFPRGARRRYPRPSDSGFGFVPIQNSSQSHHRHWPVHRGR